MSNSKQTQHTANSINAMIDRIYARNGWTRDETLRPKTAMSVTVKVAMPKSAASSTSNSIENGRKDANKDLQC
jgi:hypothetical protein